MPLRQTSHDPRASQRTGPSPWWRATVFLLLAAGLVMIGLTALVSLPRPAPDIGPPVPFAEVTTLPSGSPIRSSCGRPPRWVWKAPPSRSVIVWITPRGSVSWTRSPARKGPRRRASAMLVTPEG